MKDLWLYAKIGLYGLGWFISICVVGTVMGFIINDMITYKDDIVTLVLSLFVIVVCLYSAYSLAQHAIYSVDDMVRQKHIEECKNILKEIEDV